MAWAAVFVTEIGDASRFPSPDHLCSWTGLTPRHRESDTKVRRGSITKQGSKMVRWAALEAISRSHGGDKIKADYRRIAERRGLQHRPRRRGLKSVPPRLLRPEDHRWHHCDGGDLGPGRYRGSAEAPAVG